MPAPKRQNFSLDLIRFAVLALVDGLSLRQVEKVLTRLGEWLGFDAPDHSTVRLWGLRVGLHLWQRDPPVADDWIWILDHVAESGGGKCLKIVGVRQSTLRGRDFVLRHTDVTVLYLEVMKTSTGDDLFRILVALAARCGVPMQIVSDHGSDVLKGERLFLAEHPELLVTWDCTHHDARLILAAMKGDAVWVAFKAACQRTRGAVERTPWNALSPPSTAGSSRCEHFDTLVLWAEKALAKLDAGAAGLIDNEHRWDRTATQALRPELSPADDERLQPLLDRSFADAATFTAAVTAALGPHEQTATIVGASHQGHRRCCERFGWLETYRVAIAQDYAPLVHMTYTMERQIKHAGLHGGSAADWLATQPALPREWIRARRFRADLLRYLRLEGRGRPRAQALLATSDVLESLFGKYKRYTERSPQTELNSAILTLPLATEELTSELIERAIESTPLKHLHRWCRKTFDRTKLAVQHLLNGLLTGTEPA